MIDPLIRFWVSGSIGNQRFWVKYSQGEWHSVETKGGKSMVTNKKWWHAASIRALKTFFQTFVATVGTSVLLTEVNWMAVLSASGLAAVLSLATSLAGLPEVDA